MKYILIFLSNEENTLHTTNIAIYEINYSVNEINKFFRLMVGPKIH